MMLVGMMLDRHRALEIDDRQQHEDERLQQPRHQSEEHHRERHQEGREAEKNHQDQYMAVHVAEQTECERHGAAHVADDFDKKHYRRQPGDGSEEVLDIPQTMMFDSDNMG